MATEEPDFASHVTVAPNPTSGETVLSLGLSESHDLKIEVLNLQGQVVYTKLDNQVSGELQYALDLSNLPDGMYIAKVSVDNQLISRKINLVK